MDGRGQWRDNVFVERLWKSVKYEEVYLKAYETVSAARLGIARYDHFSDTRLPHWAHSVRTPETICFGTLAPLQAAA
jgi:putative transposase